MLNNKKADFSASWAEYLFVIVAIAGFFLSATIDNNLVIYLISYIIGLQSGFLVYHNLNSKRTFPLWLVIGGLLIGYLLGSYDASKLSIIVLFVTGIINGYMIFKKNLFFFDWSKNDKASKKR